MRNRGVLDHLDAALQLLGDIRLMETLDPGLVRQWRIRLNNAQSEIVEARRMIERDEETTPDVVAAFDISDSDTPVTSPGRGRK